MAFAPIGLCRFDRRGLFSIVLLAIVLSHQQVRFMSFGRVERALKSSSPGGWKARRGSPARAGASPTALVGTLAVCAAGGLFAGAIVAGAVLYLRPQRLTASPATYAVTAPPPARPVEPMPMVMVRPDLPEPIERRHEAIWQEIDARHAAMRQRMERRFATPVSRMTPPGPPVFRQPLVPALPIAAPLQETGLPVPGSASPLPFPTTALSEPLLPRPITVSYSRSAPHAARMRMDWGDSAPRGWSDPAEVRLERLCALTHDARAFSGEVTWFLHRRETLSDELALRIEATIADFICRSDGPEAVSVLPRLLRWYEPPDVPALARLFLRQVEVDVEGSPVERRQLLVGTMQRYRQLDGNWSRPEAADVVRGMRRSRTVVGHVVPALESLPLPYSPEMADLLVELSFDGSPDSPCAQMQALRHGPCRDRLLDAAIVRLESPVETEREAAYMVLAATDPTALHADAALDALARAFANESIEPSPMAHAALTRWLDAEHAESFDDFCDCECPIRRVAACAATGKYRASGQPQQAIAARTP